MNLDAERKQREIARNRAMFPVTETIKVEDVPFTPTELVLDLGEVVAQGQYMTLHKPQVLETMYQRKNLCLKLLKHDTTLWGDNKSMGVSSLMEATMCQNLMAFKGKAPRVYDIVKVNGRLGQITDFIEGEQTMLEMSHPDINFHDPETSQPHNQINGMLIDFQGAKFKNFNEFRKGVIKKATGKIQSKGASGRAYQSTRHFDAFRDTKERLEQYKIGDMTGKTVLDIGCNYGMIAREALAKGAFRAVGIDRPEITDIAEQLALIDGIFNIDFYGVDIRLLKQSDIEAITGLERFDVHFFLAMEHWVGLPPWIYNCSQLHIEGHGLDRDYRVEYPERKL